MSLRSTLESFAQAFRRKGSDVSIRDALEDFARALSADANAESDLSDRSKLTLLAQRILLLSTVASKDNKKLLAGACTLLAGILSKQARVESPISEMDWNWLSHWPDLLLNCLDGTYAEAELLVCHLLDSSLAKSVSSGGVNVLLERLGELPDRPPELSPSLSLLYAEYRGERLTGTWKVTDLRRGIVSQREDAEIVSDGADVVVNMPDLFDPIMESSVTNFVPAGEKDNNAFNVTDFGAVDLSDEAPVPVNQTYQGEASPKVSLDDFRLTEPAPTANSESVEEVKVPIARKNLEESRDQSGSVAVEHDPVANRVSKNRDDKSSDTEIDCNDAEGLFGAPLNSSKSACTFSGMVEAGGTHLPLPDDAPADTRTPEAGALPSRMSPETEGADAMSEPVPDAPVSEIAVPIESPPKESASHAAPRSITGQIASEQIVPEPSVADSLVAGNSASASQSDQTSSTVTLSSLNELAKLFEPAEAIPMAPSVGPDLTMSVAADIPEDGSQTGIFDDFAASNVATGEIAVGEKIAPQVSAGSDSGQNKSGDCGLTVPESFGSVENAASASGAEISTGEAPGLGDIGKAPEVDDAFRMLDQRSAGTPSLNLEFDSLAGAGETMVLDEFFLPEDPETNVSNVESAGVNPIATDGGEIVDHDSLMAEPQSAVVRKVTSASHPAGLSRAASQIVEVMLDELPEVETELGICVGLAASKTADRKLVGEATMRCAEVLERYGSAADSVGFVGLAKVIGCARKHVLAAAQGEVLSDHQVGLFAGFGDDVRLYFEAPYASGSAQPLLDWITSDGWVTSLPTDELDVLQSLLANPDLSAIEEDIPHRQELAKAEDVLLAMPEDAIREVLEGLLQELPMQSEEFSAATERLLSGGKLEDILIAQRIAHTIKGSGNTVGIRGLATLTHNVEDILMALAQENCLPTRPLARMLMNVADCLQAMTEFLLGMGPAPDDALAVLQSVLDWANLIDREGLPQGDAMPESVTLVSTHPKFEKPVASTPHAAEHVATSQNAASVSVQSQPERVSATQPEQKMEDELEAQLRVPVRLVEKMLTTAGESIILTGQLRERVHRGLADVRDMLAQFERQQQLGSELEELIDVKDFGRRQEQQDSQFDALEMDQYNELHSTARQMVDTATDARELGKSIFTHLAELDEMLINQEDLNRDSQDTVLRTRMVTVKSVFPRLQRSVRQTCRATDKQVELHLSGGDTPMDTDGLSRIVDSLMHLLRNAIDHGIEDAATRLRAGKPVNGNIYLEFQRDGNNIVINCRDDGAGLNFDAIRRTAEDRGLIGPDSSNDALKKVILRSNFSTRAQATHVSGRGVGLDAVHNVVTQLGGTMSVDSKSERGCNFEMRLPFNLISSHALLVQAGTEVIALASRGIERIIHGNDGELQYLGDKTVFRIGDNIYPASSIESIIGTKLERREAVRDMRPVVLIRSDEGVTAVSVEALLGSRELVVKSLSKYMPKLRGIVGATILGDGRVASVIDLPELLSNRAGSVVLEKTTSTDTATSSDRADGFVLVVDDSLSARKALSQFMQDSGFKVRTARDGLEATQIMKGLKPDLVLANLEMPRMNGIEMTAHMRARPETADVPVVMITSRSTVKHREQAEAAGVNVYLTKPYSEEVLNNTVNSLIGSTEAKRHERTAA